MHRVRTPLDLSCLDLTLPSTQQPNTHTNPQTTHNANRYQMASDPISTLLPYTGDVMDRRLNANTVVPASSVSFTNT